MSKKLLALLMALVLVVGLTAGCAKKAAPAPAVGTEQDVDGEPVDSVVGNWTATLDAKEMMATLFEMGVNMGADGMLDGVKFNTDKLAATFVLDLSLNEDGTYTSVIGEENPGALANSLMDVLNDSKEELMEAVLSYMGVTRAEAEAELAAEGMSWDAFMDAMMEEMENSMDLDSMSLDSEESNGYYVVDGNKLYLLEDADDDIADAESYMVFAFQGSTMVITEIGGDLGEFEDIVDTLVPIVFKQA